MLAPGWIGWRPQVKVNMKLHHLKVCLVFAKNYSAVLTEEVLKFRYIFSMYLEIYYSNQATVAILPVTPSRR